MCRLNVRVFWGVSSAGRGVGGVYPPLFTDISGKTRNHQTFSFASLLCSSPFQVTGCQVTKLHYYYFSLYVLPQILENVEYIVEY